MQPHVSIVIPTFNRADLLQNAIKSVSDQTYHEWDLIVVDDGSTEAIDAIVRSIMPEARCLRQENAGQAKARNLGVSHAHGPWIAFLDSDDTWSKYKLERQVAFATSLQLDACFHDMTFNAPDTGQHLTSWNDYCANLYNRPPLPSAAITDPFEVIVRGGDMLFSPSFLIRKSLFESLGGYDTKFHMCEDIDLYLRLAARTKIGYIAEPLGVVRWGTNWDIQATYRHRIKAFRKSLDQCQQCNDRPNANVVKRGIVRELRSLAGWQRRNQRPVSAIVTYAASLLAWGKNFLK